MFRRTLAAVVTSASLAPHLAALFVGYEIESEEDRTRRQPRRLDAPQAPAPPPAELPAPTDAAP